jgi:hypothetical protein
MTRENAKERLELVAAEGDNNAFFFRPANLRAKFRRKSFE